MMIRHTAPSLALGLCEPDHTAPARSKRRGAFADQRHGRIVTPAKAYEIHVRRLCGSIWSLISVILKRCSFRDTALQYRFTLGSARQATLGCRERARDRRPAATPSHQIIVSEMFMQQRQIAPAVAIAIFELSANLSDRPALPRHLDGRHHPARMARNALIRRALMQGEVAVGVAGHTGHVTQRERLVRMNVVCLRRAVTSRMAV